MAKLNPEKSTSRTPRRTAQRSSWSVPAGRQSAALAPDFEAEELDRDPEADAYLRPPAARRRKARPVDTDLVPNYEALGDALGHPYANAGDAADFLRTRRRLTPRKEAWWRRLLGSGFGRVVFGVLVLAVLLAVGFAIWAVRDFLEHDAHFRIDSSASIQTDGVTELSRPELLSVFGSDIGRNIFFVPLKQRVAALESQPWVQHATVMRILPDTLRVSIQERVPIAFVRIGHQIELVDAQGFLLTMPPAMLAARHYDFPVVTGLNPDSPAADRAVRMQLYQRFIAALNSGGAHVSSQLSEVDLTDVDDVRAVVPAQGTDILLHFGNSDFLERYHSYLQHLPEWRQQYPGLSAVDLRYDRQVVLKMADAAQADQAAESAEAGKLAAAQAAASAPLTPKPAQKARHAAPAHKAKAAHAKGKKHAAHWTPHYIAHAGRAQ